MKEHYDYGARLWVKLCQGQIDFETFIEETQLFYEENYLGSEIE